MFQYDGMLLGAVASGAFVGGETAGGEMAGTIHVPMDDHWCALLKCIPISSSRLFP